MSDISEALELFDEISQDESHNRAQWLEAMRFYNGEQWPSNLKMLRETDPNGARPCLVINVLPHHVKQVVNEMRQNRPSIRILPVDDGADVETAKALQGLCRHIENRSDSDVVYTTGGRNAVIGGFGYWRVLTEYTDEKYGYQEIRLSRVLNPLTVYMARCDCPAGSDAEDVFVTDLINKKAFKRRYGKEAPDTLPTQGTGDDTWLTDDYVRVAEWFHVKHVEHKAVRLHTGMRMKVSALEEIRQKTGQSIEVNSDNEKILERQVIWKKITGAEVLDERTLDGRYIPVVRVLGQEVDVEGKRFHYGMVRDAIDPQRMRNYWRSCETEMIALAPKAPFIGAAGAFDGFESTWARANVQNLAYLEYNAVDVEGRPVPAPQRQPATPIPNAIVQAAANADWDIKAATGIFGAALGEPSKEQSGRALIERKSESDMSTFDYIDNLSVSIRHTGRILVDLIPKVYDTPRIQRILGEDGEPQMVRFDPEMQEAHREEKGKGYEGVFNPSVGRYDVEVEVGPSYATKRQQAAESMAQILQGNPELWQAAGDLFAKNLDWPGADQLAERLKKMVPPQLLEQDDEEQEHNPQDVATIQQLDQTIQAMSAEMEQMQAALQEAQSKQSETVAKSEADKKKRAVDQYRAETERMKLIADHPDIASLFGPLGLMPELLEEPTQEETEPPHQYMPESVQ